VIKSIADCIAGSRIGPAAERDLAAIAGERCARAEQNSAVIIAIKIRIDQNRAALCGKPAAGQGNVAVIIDRNRAGASRAERQSIAAGERVIAGGVGPADVTAIGGSSQRLVGRRRHCAGDDDIAPAILEGGAHRRAIAVDAHRARAIGAADGKRTGGDAI